MSPIPCVAPQGTSSAFAHSCSCPTGSDAEPPRSCKPCRSPRHLLEFPQAPRLPHGTWPQPRDMGGTRVGHGQQRQVAPLAQCTAWTQSVDWTASQASRTTRQVACQGLHGRRNPPDEHQGSHQGQSTASNGTRHARREASGAQGDDEERPAAFWHWDCAGEPLHNAPNKGETLPGWQGLAAMTLEDDDPDLCDSGQVPLTELE